MPYTNFTDAWNDWTTLLAGVKTNWNSLNTEIPLVRASGSVFSLASHTANALEFVRDMFDLHLQNGFSSLPTSSISHYQAVLYAHNEAPGGGVTLDDILNAMLAAKFEQLQQFIGIVDAYRVALWNAPFNAEFYGALARGFVKWPQF